MPLNAGTLLARLRLDTTQFDASLEGSKAKMTRLERTSVMATRGLKILATAGFVATAAAVVKGTAEFAKFEKELLNVGTLVGKQAETLLPKFKAQIMALHPELGSATELTKGLYQALSAGIEPAKAVMFVAEAAKAAKAGLSDVFTAVDAGTTIMNANAMQAEDATKIYDQMFQTVVDGKCVVGSTRVLLADGRYKRIDNLGQGGTIVSFDGRTFTPMKAQWVDQGVKSTVRLKTRLGRQIDTTWNHPYLTRTIPEGYKSSPNRIRPQKAQWKKVSELKIGDRIAVPTALPYFGNKEVPEEEAGLLGLWLAEGACHASSPRMASCDYGDKISQWAKAYDCEAKNMNKRNGKTPDWLLSSGKRGGRRKNQILELLRHHGLNQCTSETKHVPSEVFTWSRKSIAIFLYWLFNGDGWLADLRKHRSGFQLGFASKSERLVRDLSHLLLRFGIVGNIRYRNEGYGYWVWEAHRYKEVHRFVSFIGIDRPAEKDVLEHYPEYERAQWGVVEFDPITVIEPQEEEHVYDLTVEVLHNFVANDIIAHNTTFEQLAGGIGRVATVAASAKVPTEELFAALASLTKAGLSTDEAVTALRATILNYLKPQDSAVKLAKEMNLELSAEALARNGLFKSMIDLGEAIGDNTEKYAELFPNIRAIVGVLPLASKMSKDFTQNLRNQYDAAGRTTEALSIQRPGLSFQFDTLKNAVSKAMIPIGEFMKDFFIPMMKWGTKAAGIMGKITSKLPGGQKEVDLITIFNKRIRESREELERLQTVRERMAKGQLAHLLARDMGKSVEEIDELIESEKLLISSYERDIKKLTQERLGEEVVSQLDAEFGVWAAHFGKKKDLGKQDVQDVKFNIDEKRSAEEELNARIKELTLDEFGFRKWQLDQDLEHYKSVTDNKKLISQWHAEATKTLVKEEADYRKRQTEKAFDAMVREAKEAWKKENEAAQAQREIYDEAVKEAVKGAEKTSEAWVDAMERIEWSTQYVLSDTFRDVLKGEEDAFENFTDRLLDSWIDLIADMTSEWLTSQIFGDLTSGKTGGGGGGLLSGIWNWITSFQRGGPVEKTGVYSLHKGEYVLSEEAIKRLLPYFGSFQAGGYVTGRGPRTSEFHEPRGWVGTRRGVSQPTWLEEVTTTKMIPPPAELMPAHWFRQALAQQMVTSWLSGKEMGGFTATKSIRDLIQRTIPQPTTVTTTEQVERMAPWIEKLLGEPSPMVPPGIIGLEGLQRGKSTGLGFLTGFLAQMVAPGMGLPGFLFGKYALGPVWGAVKDMFGWGTRGGGMGYDFGAEMGRGMAGEMGAWGGMATGGGGLPGQPGMGDVGFQKGGGVEATGWGYMHKGEYVLNKPDVDTIIRKQLFDEPQRAGGDIHIHVDNLYAKDVHQLVEEVVQENWITDYGTSKGFVMSQNAEKLNLTPSRRPE